MKKTAPLCGHATDKVIRGVCEDCYKLFHRASRNGQVTMGALVAAGKIFPGNGTRKKGSMDGTVAQLICLALHRASGDHDDCCFTAEDVAVLAYRLDPGRFALKGYPEYPDMRQIAAELSRGPVVRLQLLRRVSRGRYRLTAAGVAAATNGRAA